MDKADIAIVLALCAAFWIAVGDAVQQRKAQQVTDEPVGHAGLLIRLLRDPTWWLGSLAGTAGFGFRKQKRSKRNSMPRRLRNGECG